MYTQEKHILSICYILIFFSPSVMEFMEYGSLHDLLHNNRLVNPYVCMYMHVCICMYVY